MTDVNHARLGVTQLGLSIAGAPSLNAHVVDASTEGIAIVFEAPYAMTVTKLRFRYGTRTGTPPTYIAGLEGVSASTGEPDGTYLGGGTPASVTFTPPPDTSWNSLVQEVTLDNSIALTRSQKCAMTIRYSSGTIDGSNNSSFVTDATSIGLGGPQVGFPYALRNISGTWAKRSELPIYGLVTASSTYGALFQSGYSTRTASTVGHRMALKFKLPSGFCSSFTVAGLVFNGSWASTPSKNPVFGLWSASSALQTSALDGDKASGPANTYRYFELLFDDTTLTTLSPGTDYYIGLEVADAVAAGVLINGYTMGAASDMSQFPFGSTWCLSTYDGSSWTDIDTVLPMAALILGDITGGSGSGGNIGPGGVFYGNGNIFGVTPA